MTVLDVIARWGQTESVFRRYDAAAGVCLCCVALFESVSAVAEVYRLDLEELLNDLKAVI